MSIFNDTPDEGAPFEPEIPGDDAPFEIYEQGEDEPFASAYSLAAAEDAMKFLVTEGGYGLLECRHRDKEGVLSSCRMTPEPHVSHV